jgi:hypothetical protein
MNRMRRTIVFAALVVVAVGCGREGQTLTAPEMGNASVSTDASITTHGGAENTTTSGDSTAARGGGWAGSGH